MKTTLFIKRVAATARNHAVETAISLIAAIFGIILIWNSDSIFGNALQYMPAFFLLAYTLRECMPSPQATGPLAKSIPVLYYLSGLFWIPLLFLPTLEFPSPLNTVSTVIAVLLYPAVTGVRDNKAFFGNLLFYLRGILFAGAVSVVAYLLICTIFGSFFYIFGLEKHSMSRLLGVSASLCFLFIFPMLFLVFHGKRAERVISYKGRVFNIFVNYVFTPAILIYGIVLYLYIIRIVFDWSLPIGGVAYMVIGFVAALFLFKGCRLLTEQRFLNFIYDKASWIALPTLVLLWVSWGNRVSEYGFTVNRVYLAVVGSLLTAMAVYFLFRRTASYRYALWTGIFLCAVVTYIPGITATDIESHSQSGREDSEQDVAITYQTITPSETINIEGYRHLTRLHYYTDVGPRIKVEDDYVLIFNDKDELIYSSSQEAFLKEQFRKNHLPFNRLITEKEGESLLYLDLGDKGTVVFNNLLLNFDTEYHLVNIEGGVLLTR